jgi:hypothetical protein
MLLSLILVVAVMEMLEVADSNVRIFCCPTEKIFQDHQWGTELYDFVLAELVEHSIALSPEAKLSKIFFQN